jgi:hypothetical protein
LFFHLTAFSIIMVKIKYFVGLTYDTEEFFIGLVESTTKQENVPYLDLSSAHQNGEETICVVNRHKDKAITTDIISQKGVFNENLYTASAFFFH